MNLIYAAGEISWIGRRGVQGRVSGSSRPGRTGRRGNRRSLAAEAVAARRRLHTDWLRQKVHLLGCAIRLYGVTIQEPGEIRAWKFADTARNRPNRYGRLGEDRTAIPGSLVRCARFVAQNWHRFPDSVPNEPKKMAALFTQDGRLPRGAWPANVS